MEDIRRTSLTMRHSREIKNVVAVMYEKLKELGLALDGGAAIIVFPEDSKDAKIGVVSPLTPPTFHDLPYDKEAASDNPVLLDLWKAREEHCDIVNKRYTFEKKNRYFKYVFRHNDESVLPLPVREFILKAKSYTATFIAGRNLWLGVNSWTEEILSKKDITVLRDITRVFEQAYTRFLDLQKAEAHARESQIQLSLEKVRARTMAMVKPQELDAVIKILYAELKQLDVSFARCFIMIFDDQKGATWWMGSPDGNLFHEGFYVPYHEHPPHLAFLKGWEGRQKKWNYVLGGQIKEDWDEFLFNNTGLSKLPPVAIEDMRSFDHACLGASFENFGCITTGGLQPLNEESYHLLSRFAKVFDLTYTRFLDLQKAEAQAREAEIELALERVRARTMAMQKSEELQEVVHTLLERLKDLDVEFYTAIIILFAEDSKDIIWWLENKEKQQYSRILIPYAKITYLRDLFNTREKGGNHFSKTYSFEEKNELFRHLFSATDFKNVPGKQKKFLLETEAATMSVAISKNTGLHLTRYSGNAFSKNDNEILKRFAKVFDQTYTRFLDLQKAEAQAREAEIEASLERVRATSMAMHKSHELQEVIKVVCEQLLVLGIKLDSTLFIKVLKDGSWDVWNTTPTQTYPAQINIPFKRIPPMTSVNKANAQGKKEVMLVLSKKEKDEFLGYFFSGTDARSIPVARKTYVLNSPGHALSFFFMKNIILGITTLSGIAFSEEENVIFRRFTKVFEQAYTRFLDLQKAEAQAREGQIQLAMERVRARTMAMRRSEELAEVATVLFQQVKSLGVPQWVCGFSIWEIGDTEFTWYPGSPDGEILTSCKVPLTEHPVFISFDESRKRGDELFVYEKQGEFQTDHYRYMMSLPGMRELLQNMLGSGLSIPPFQIDHIANFSHGNLVFITYEHIPQMHDVFKRFAKVFEQTYTRFLDLQKAEAQAREAQIETALEKIRSRSLAMHHSTELKDVITITFEKLSELDVLPGTVGIQLFDQKGMNSCIWVGNTIQDPQKVDLPYDELMMQEDTLLKDCWQAMADGLDIINKEYSFEQKNKYFNYLFANNDLTQIPEAAREVLRKMERHIACFFTEKNSAFLVDSWNGQIFPNENVHIIKRAAKVFEQAYIRFLDLQKAEAQAREAQIEAALERVRASAMAMHSSEGLSEVATVLREQMALLGEKELESILIHIYDEKRDEFEAWYAYRHPGDQKRDVINGRQVVSWSKTARARMDKVRYHGDDDNYTIVADHDMLKEWYEHLHQIVPVVVEMNENGEISVPEVLYYNYSKISGGALLLITNNEASEQSKNLLMRAARVFNLAYSRFLDLKKAEKSAREARIENALEKVRSRSLAMHASGELQQVVAVVLERLKELDIATDAANINIFSDGSRDVDLWVASPGQDYANCFHLPYTNLAIPSEIFTARERGDDFFAKTFSWQEKNEYFNYLFEHSDFKHLPVDRKSKMLAGPAYAVSFAFTKKAAISIHSYSGKSFSEEENDILKRFATVFEQAYIRFLDLQKAEAQAREAQIEAALERVRSRTMAMQASAELAEIINTIQNELAGLEFRLNNCIFWIMQEKPLSATWWVASVDNALLPTSYHVPFPDLEYFNAISDAWHQRIPRWLYELQGPGKNAVDEYLFSKTSLVHFPDSVKNAFRRTGKVYIYFSFYNYGGLHISTLEPLTNDQRNIIDRFSKVFDLAYTRFNDLEHAEANAKEAVKQAALDRIRGDIASMRTVSDLDRITPLIWNELTILGVPFIRCGVFIMDGPREVIHTFLSSPEGTAIAAFDLPYSIAGKTRNILDNWQKHTVYCDHWNDSDFVDLAETLAKEKIIQSADQYLATLPHGGFHLHFLPFLQGMMYVGNTEKLGPRELELIQSVADTFSTAYARYEDFNKLEVAKRQVENTLTELKATQAQLIQSEKMASLGELTAGVAHEIQNPLNFVNNFSEVNAELIEEVIDRRSQGNTEDIDELLADIAANEQKINYHGKRADAIVKSMLSHSRQPRGLKEDTDINALCDEYLRLSYHGMRAKFKDLTCLLKTDFAKSMGKVDMIPQDIGRVFLNIFNNAFYEMHEKRLKSIGYEPAIEVSTRQVHGKIRIRIIDNGNGIPTHILDKIFQPFFTTKPTGEGTGLGLSLSYDIVKAHGGELYVESSEGSGTEFIIELPS